MQKNCLLNWQVAQSWNLDMRGSYDFYDLDADILLSGLKSIVSLVIAHANDASLAAVSKYANWGHRWDYYGWWYIGTSSLVPYWNYTNVWRNFQ